MASTVTLTEAQRLEILPEYVTRYPGEKELAKVAAKKTTIDAAFKELAKLIDGKTDTIADFKEFMDIHLSSTEVVAQKALLFELHTKGLEAEVPTDVICKKFFSEIPDGSKLYEANKSLVKAEMDLTAFVTLITTIQEKMKPMQQPVVVKEEVFSSSLTRPKSVDTMMVDLKEIKKAVAQRDTEDEDRSNESSEDVFEVDTRPKCQICKKKSHTEETCWLRICKFCKGKGHDMEKCPSMANRKKFRAKGPKKL